MKRLALLLLLVFAVASARAQQQDLTHTQILTGRGPFTHDDTLRGTLGPLRSCYDVTHYDLQLRVDPAAKTIAGNNTITYKTVTPFNTLQIDLFETMTIDSVVADNVRAAWQPLGKRCFTVALPAQKQTGEGGRITVYYHGKPTEAPNPPWDGGFVWKQDGAGKPWVGVACEGFGASSWWPLKDHPADEPDSMRFVLGVPTGLMGVANGTLRSVVTREDGYTDFEWTVGYPINSYNVTVNIADYAHFAEAYRSDSSSLQLDYYVLRANLAKAKEHFEQVKPMMACFEKFFGPYPFPKDGFALVETSYWGMEHQGAIAYGNNYRNSKWGWDFIIVHESGHEWFGNSITACDHADMFIHESFTTYMEAVYMECRYGRDKAVEYLKTQRDKIQNVDAIQAPYGVNYNDWKNADMYYKGTWMLHTLRNVLDNDELWFKILRGVNRKFFRSVVCRDQFLKYFSTEAGQDLTPFFSQYLDYLQPPKVQYALLPKGKKSVVLQCRLLADRADLKLPITFVWNDGDVIKKQRITLTASVQSVTLPAAALQTLRWDTDSYYVTTERADKRIK